MDLGYNRWTLVGLGPVSGGSGRVESDRVGLGCEKLTDPDIYSQDERDVVVVLLSRALHLSSFPRHL